MQSLLIVRKASSKMELESVFAIRQIVFVQEQNCPPELEWEYEAESVHFLAYINDFPAGTARWRKTDNGYKLERFAVLPEFRGKRVAQALIKAVLSDLPVDANYIYLNSQVQAVNLYQKFGFKEVGEAFEEAGIQHFKMVLNR